MSWLARRRILESMDFLVVIRRYRYMMFSLRASCGDFKNTMLRTLMVLQSSFWSIDSTPLNSLSFQKVKVVFLSPRMEVHQVLRSENLIQMSLDFNSLSRFSHSVLTEQKKRRSTSLVNSILMSRDLVTKSRSKIQSQSYLIFLSSYDSWMRTRISVCKISSNPYRDEGSSPTSSAANSSCLFMIPNQIITVQIKLLSNASQNTLPIIIKNPSLSVKKSQRDQYIRWLLLQQIMVLYELIVLVKCAQAKATANMARNVALSIMHSGGNVREVKVLSDRILPRARRCNDFNKYLVGRYLQILFDGNPTVAEEAAKKAQASYETMKLDLFRVKDFYTHSTQFQKNVDSSRVIDSEARESQTISKVMKVKRQI